MFFIILLGYNHHITKIHSNTERITIMKNDKGNILEKLNERGRLEDNNITFSEYIDNLLEIQKVVLEIVFDSENTENMRIDDAIYILETKARERELYQDPVVGAGIKWLKFLRKEISIGVAGKKCEDIVAKTLEFLDRPGTYIFRNVSASNEVECCEIDNVLITNEGIVLLEVKSAKSDITISNEGRLFHNNVESYEKNTLAEKMSRKRLLLRETIVNELKKKDIRIPVSVESFVVFSSPKGMRIKVVDNYRKEKWCFRTELNKKLEWYRGRETYSKEDMEILKDVISDIKKQRKPFPIPYNQDEVLDSVSSMLNLLLTSQLDDGKETGFKLFEQSYTSINNTPRKLAVVDKSQEDESLKAILQRSVHDVVRCIKQNKRKALATGGLAGALFLGAITIKELSLSTTGSKI